jgi:hypothetical protein
MKTLKEIVTGIPKEVLEYLESNTELAKTAIESHKKDFSNNIKYLFIGFLFSISGTIIIELMSKSEKELMYKQLYEINAFEKNLKIEFKQMHLKIESLKIELDSLKKSS